MEYREYPIITSLQPFVKLIWSMESDLPSVEEGPMRILPDCCVEIVFHYKDAYTSTFSDGSQQLQSRSFVVTQMKSFMEIQSTGTTGFISIRFSATGAYLFFGIPMKDIAGSSTDLTNAWGPIAHEIEDRIQNCHSNTERVSVIQHYLYIQATKSYTLNKTISFCLNEIARTNGQLPMSNLAKTAGVSNRQLLRQFDQYVGMSPKEFARIVKFNGALQYMAGNSSASMIHTAHTCGYYDQAHFIRDFKEYAGLTPTEYMERSNVFF